MRQIHCLFTVETVKNLKLRKHNILKRQFTQKIKTLSLTTHLHVVPNPQVLWLSSNKNYDIFDQIYELSDHVTSGFQP